MIFANQYLSNPLNWKVVMFLLSCIFAFVVCIAIVGYILLFYCKKTLDDFNIFFNDYNSSSKNIIYKYGDYRITRAYLITNPLTNLTVCMLNLITMQNSKQVLDDAMHLQLMIEIKINKHEKKMILIDKTNCINIMTDFQIDDKYVIIPIKLKKKHKSTLRDVLDKTCDRVGKIKFFNWHVYKNNCHFFIKNLIFQLNNGFKSRCIKSPKKFKYLCNKLFCNAVNMYLYYVFMFLYNFFQKYIVNIKDDVISRMMHLIHLSWNKLSLSWNKLFRS